MTISPLSKFGTDLYYKIHAISLTTSAFLTALLCRHHIWTLPNRETTCSEESYGRMFRQVLPIKRDGPCTILIRFGPRSLLLYRHCSSSSYSNYPQTVTQSWEAGKKPTRCSSHRRRSDRKGVLRCSPSLPRTRTDRRRPRMSEVSALLTVNISRHQRLTSVKSEIDLSNISYIRRIYQEIFGCVDDALVSK